MPVSARSIANLRVGGGRAGMPSKLNHSIKEMVEKALHKAGGVEYLTRQAEQNPVAFMGLVGRVLPLQLANADGSNALVIDFRWADAPPTINGDAVAPDTVSHETNDTDEQPAITFISDC